jgi:aspartyl-tRNA(Asn)/glutamyl-tRNA(Gln) amidotransferase subunit A
MTMASLADLAATQLVQSYRSSTLSPVEVMNDVLARIEASEPVLKALWAFDPEGALAQARQSEARWQQATPVGPLDGVPMTIKDNIATRGTATPLGCAAVPLVPAGADAPPAARSREAGAILLAKTTMPDYGMLSSGLSSFHALARNPWNIALNPGGSSAGAAAAAAAGYGPLHIGTDIGGSIRLPAGWCGLVGLKPSYGRIPIDPTYIGRVAGPLTRTVADTALMMAVLSLPDARDPASLPYQDLAWSDLDIDVRGLRIGLWLDAGFGAPVEPEVRDAVEDAGRRFADAGAIVEPVASFLTRTMMDGLDKFWRTRSWSDLSRLSPEARAKVLPYIVEWAEGASGLSGAEVFAGFSQIDAMRDAALRASAGFDYLLSPTAPMPAFPAEWASPLNDPQRPFEHIAFTVAFNMSGQPAVSVNSTYTADGLPIGVQISGARFDDLGVLRMARFYETIRPSQRPWPII